MKPEPPEKPAVPDDLKAPGLIYRYRRAGWEMWWAPRSDLMKRRYPGKMARLRAPQPTAPTRAEWEAICTWCHRHNQEQLIWARGGSESDPNSWFDGTIAGLIAVYEKHKRSPYQQLRHDSERQYASALAALRADIGKVRVEHITFDDLASWQEEFAVDPYGGKPMKARAAQLIGQLKRLAVFGALVLPKEAGCHDLCDVFAKMAEAKLMGTYRRQRKQYMTAAQARLIRAKAHEMGHHSIAIEQAFAFELGLRQGDVIGQWLPRAYPGVTDIYAGPRKWLIGIRWEEIDANLILTHRLSKSLRGKSAVMDAEAGKVKAWDLREYPMVVDELRRIAGSAEFTRADLPVAGPLIIREKTGQPWTRTEFRGAWRTVAVEAGLPETLQNRDSRPGAATEAKLAGAARDDIQRQLGHADGATTEIYLREEVEEQRKLARLRVEKRK